MTIPILQNTRNSKWTGFPKSFITKNGITGSISLYLEWRYGKKIKPVARRKECDIPDDCTCPRCNAPKPYLYKNNGSKGQVLCKVCSTAFSPEENRFAKPFTLRCPYCSHALVRKKERKQFAVHKCVNLQCPYYLHNLQKSIRKTLRRTTAKTNTSCTISTVSSPWIFSAWI